jgi:hypothetical protein
MSKRLNEAALDTQQDSAIDLRADFIHVVETEARGLALPVQLLYGATMCSAIAPTFLPIDCGHHDV